ncbi:hypothetical protein SCE1572_50805 [Sorangium cellulosum So0157-2]|uniref:Uncharacterized protein n=2 Tax=Sorangium cellulosum TaxID=56 RepID=S4Y999_SORCE|nr:hypothetical protein SCE1572_50805 [Sorangium cellulosum So0157-2]
MWSNVRMVAILLLGIAVYEGGRSLSGSSSDPSLLIGSLGVFCAVASLGWLAFGASGPGKVGLGFLAAAGMGVAIGAASMEGDFARRIAVILCMSALPLSIAGASLEVRRRRQAGNGGRPPTP